VPLIDKFSKERYAYKSFVYVTIDLADGSTLNHDDNDKSVKNCAILQIPFINCRYHQPCLLNYKSYTSKLWIRNICVLRYYRKDDNIFIERHLCIKQ
jgi:hypothetical protein